MVLKYYSNTVCNPSTKNTDIPGFFFGVYEKTQGEKTQTQGKWIKNSRIFSLKTQEIGNFKVNCRQNLYFQK